MKFGAIAVTMLAVSGCVSHQPPSWYSADVNDKFRDEHSCSMTVATEDVGSSHFTFSGNFYPFVQKFGDELMVGVSSVPQPGPGATTFRPSIPIPTGDIELKVDNNPTWTLASAETRIREHPGSTPALLNQQMQQSVKSMVQANPGLAAVVTSTQENIQKMLLPRTTVTGDKAKQIIEQMRIGKTVAFRQVSPGNVGRSWEYPLTGFSAQLARCGV